MIALPGYTIIEEIGRGGMATVYRARQTLLDREVALKVLGAQLTRSPGHAERFLQEARLLAALEHPHIVRVFDVGVSPEGLHYFSMQLLPGGDLGKRLREGMSEAELARVLEALADALGFAHARGYVHRDVSPANILFDLHGEPILTDFGIARVMAAASRLTPTGLSIGTGRYMSPEQAQGLDVDRRSDIYSLGVVTYEAVAGQLPFERDDAMAIAMAHVSDPVPPLPEECGRWQPLIDGALAKDPAQRFRDCSEFIEALHRALPEVFPQQRAAPAAVALPKPRKRRRSAPDATQPSRAWVPRAGLALAAVGVLGIAAWALWPQGEVSPRTADAGPLSQRAAPVRAEAPAGGRVFSEQPFRSSAEAADAAPADFYPPAVVDPGMLPTVRDPVPILLALADADLAAQRLTIPPQNNALERYRLVLRFDPDNPRAGAGILAVGNAYLELADAIDAIAQPGEWLQMLQRAEAVAATHPAAAGLADAANERRNSQVAALLERGRDAASRWDRGAALEAYRAALAVQPELQQARDGVVAAERIGARGFAFSDPLGEDASGPAMVLLGEEIAIAAHELTVADFTRFWAAAGEAAFGADLPLCRDREKGFLSGALGKRNWQSPDLPTGARHPVVCISHPMAVAYARWLTRQTGATYRLPTAAEWRQAHGGGGGGAACAEANRRDAAYRAENGGRDGGTCNDGFAGTAPVASFAARGVGLYDLDGNVREWVSDCGASCSERRALGGAWLIDGDGDEAFDADKGYNSIGVRLVREWTGLPRSGPE